MKKMFRFSAAFLALILALTVLFGCAGITQEDVDAVADMLDQIGDILLEDTSGEAPENTDETEIPADTPTNPVNSIAEDGTYTTKEDVALYLFTYNKLPQNFITKDEARNLGWSGGGLEDYAPGKCIGGDHFGNYEGLLPEKDGRTYTECDIDTLGKDSRGSKRIVFSNDGLIYYTDDHYESFTLLYGEADA